VIRLATSPGELGLIHYLTTAHHAP
jgi:hypothetical protein